MNIQELKKWSIVDFLRSLGFNPKFIKGNDYWYISPFRDERTPSFKVNQKMNVWYDHGIGKGGNLVDFAVLHFNCSVSDLLKKYSEEHPSFSFHPPLHTEGLPLHQQLIADEKKNNDGRKIIILEARPLTEKTLIDYLKSRCISSDMAKLHCKEVNFLLYGKTRTVIGFQNNDGGYELRSRDFKGCSSPKAVTFINSGMKSLAVFEGFFNYLSILSMKQPAINQSTNFLVLNSLALFHSSRPCMEKHERVNLYLDRDKAGVNCTLEALQWNKDKYTDQSCLYHGHKDLNEWLAHHQPDIKNLPQIRRSF